MDITEKKEKYNQLIKQGLKPSEALKYIEVAVEKANIPSVKEVADASENLAGKVAGKVQSKVESVAEDFKRRKAEVQKQEKELKDLYDKELKAAKEYRTKRDIKERARRAAGYYKPKKLKLRQVVQTQPKFYPPNLQTQQPVRVKYVRVMKPPAAYDLPEGDMGLSLESMRYDINAPSPFFPQSRQIDVRKGKKSRRQDAVEALGLQDFV